METRPCKHCLCRELAKSQFQILEFPLVLIGARPYRCSHCLRRQYAFNNPLVLAAIAAFRKLDNTVSMLHPAMIAEYFSQRQDQSRTGKPSPGPPTSTAD